jgi:signal transduction histidine kinase
MEARGRVRYRGDVSWTVSLPRARDDALAVEQAALRRVATLVAAGAGAEEIFDSVSHEAASVTGGQAGAVIRFDDDEGVFVGRWDSGVSTGFPVGERIPLADDGAVARVHRTGEVTRIDDYGVLSGEVATRVRRSGMTSVVAAPIQASGATWGVLAVGTTADGVLPPETEDRLREFAELVSLAIASAADRDALIESRRRIATAADAERRRLGRNLHDGAQQRLVSATLLLELSQTKLDGAARELVGQALAELLQAQEELRELARGLHPVALAERGLEPALRALTANAPLPVDFEVVETRLPDQLEAAAYYVISEALANVGKYANATRARVCVELGDGEAVLEVSDDGRGGADPGEGSGLRGLADRVEALRGTLEVVSPKGGGTTLRARIPLTPRPS